MRHMWLILLLAMTACVQQQQVLDHAQVDSGDLMTWLERDLSPNLANQLAQDPRFRDQSVMLVKLNGSEIQPEIDQLTRYIRQQVKASLLDTPGIRLPWLPVTQLPKHHRRLPSIQCRQSTTADYYIGVEINPILADRYQVSIRALDVSGHQWVNGFGLNWQGHLTDDELQALSSFSVDESLRGLRALPFTTRQTDMAADYLANNVSCLLQQQDEDQLLVHVQPTDTRIVYMDRLLKLVANNLSRYHEVSITNQASQADFILTLDALTVQPGVEQVWTAISRRHSGVRLSGMDTSTYIAQVSAKPQSGKSFTTKPAIRAMEVASSLNRALCGGLAGHCNILTVDVLDATGLFIVQHHAPAQLSYLPAEACGVRVQSLGADSDRHRVPINTSTGETTLHAIAVDQYSRSVVAAHLNKLPRSCANPMDSLGSLELNRWLTQLEQIMLQQQPHIAWAATRTIH